MPREIAFIVRLSEDEKELIREAATREGQVMSAWARRLLLTAAGKALAAQSPAKVPTKRTMR